MIRQIVGHGLLKRTVAVAQQHQHGILVAVGDGHVQGIVLVEIRDEDGRRIVARGMKRRRVLKSPIAITQQDAYHTATHHQVEMPVAVEIGYADGILPGHGIERILDFEVAVAKAKQNNHVNVADDEVRVRISIEVTTDDRRVPNPHLVDHLRVEPAVAGSHQDGDRIVIDRGQIRETVVVKIVAVHAHRRVAHGKTCGPKGPISAAHKDAYRIVFDVGHSQVRQAVGIQIGNVENVERGCLVSRGTEPRRLERAVALAQPNGNRSRVAREQVGMTIDVDIRAENLTVPGERLDRQRIPKRAIAVVQQQVILSVAQALRRDQIDLPIAVEVVGRDPTDSVLQLAGPSRCETTRSVVPVDADEPAAEHSNTQSPSRRNRPRRGLQPTGLRIRQWCPNSPGGPGRYHRRCPAKRLTCCMKRLRGRHGRPR